MNPPPEDDDDAARRQSYAVLVAGLVIAVLGIWLGHLLYSELQLERCQEERRRDCEPIAIPENPDSN